MMGWTEDEGIGHPRGIPFMEDDQDSKPYALGVDLYRFAHFPHMPDTLAELASLAYQEGWQFKNPDGRSRWPDVEILERHLRAVYRRCALDFNAARGVSSEDLCIHIGNRHACFHTGLFSRRGDKAIYMLFAKEIPRTNAWEWIFQAFILEDDALLGRLNPRPEYPLFIPEPDAAEFYPDWPVYIDLARIEMGRELLARLPRILQNPKTVKRQLQGALTESRRKAGILPGHVAQVVVDDRVQYALPLFLTGTLKPDMVAILMPEDGMVYAAANSLLLPERVYNAARLLGFVRRGWLAELVEDTDMNARR